MRTLTDDEVVDEVRLIDQEPAWPVWPVMPVKHIHRGEPDYPKDREVGIILADEGGGKRTVYFINLWQLKTGLLKPQLEGVPAETFESTEAMVRAGWIGD